MERRAALAAAIAAASAATLSMLAPPLAQAQAQAQPGADWPAKPVRVVVAFTAGGTTDLLARSVSQQLGDRFRQPFVIDNKPGAGGNIGTGEVVRAAPDGYTMIVNSVGPMAVNLSLYKKLPFNPLNDLEPVVQIADVPNVLVVHPSVKANTLAEFVALARSGQGALNYSSTGIGTSSHLAGFMLGQRGGYESTHVPYKGAEALKDLLAGRVQFMFATIPSVIQHIRSGALRPLAVSSLKRSRSMPEVPTVAESGYPGFEAGSWFGYFAPKGTPPAVVRRINAAVNEIVKLPEIERQMVQEGADPIGGTPEAFGRFVRAEHEKWKVVVRESGATID